MKTEFLNYLFGAELTLGMVVLSAAVYLIILERKRHRGPFDHRMLRLLRAILPAA